MKKQIVFIVFFLFLSKIFFAADFNLQKNFLTVENGLSHNEVTAIVQDKDGFIWIGTRGGLNRYDGYEFEVFNQIPGDSNSLVNPSIESLFVDSIGNVWIGTKSGGVSKYNPVTGEFKNIATNYKHSSPVLPDNRVLCFYQDKYENIWMGTWEHGLVIYNEKENTSKQYLGKTMINSITETDEGKVWVGANNGLYEYIEGQDNFEFYNVGAIQELVYDKKQNALWMLESNIFGFRKFDLRNNKLTKIPFELEPYKNLNSIPFQSVLLDSNNRLWLGTWGIGLFTFNKKLEKFKRYLIYPENRGSVNKDYDVILDIFEDKSGNIWLGTNGGGACVLTTKLKFNSVGFHPEPGKGLINTRIMSVVDDSKQNLWLGTIGSGLIWSPNRKNFIQVDYPEGIDKSKFFVIKNIYEDIAGTIWVGTSVGTFFIDWENKNPKLIRASSRYKINAFNRQIVSFLDAENMLWIGSLQNGLTLIDKTKQSVVKHINIQNKKSGIIKSNRISFLLKDAKKRVWLGTYNGLHIYNPKDTTVNLAESYFTFTGDLSGNIITCLDQDQKGNIWVGTPNGLNKLTEIEEGHFNVTYYSQHDGLNSIFIKGISHDLNGNIWVSTNNGISKLITSETRFINFDETDGVQGKEFTEASVFKNNNGEIFFGGTHGLTYFHPDKIVEHELSPKPVFTGLKVLNQDVVAGQLFDHKKILEKSITHSSGINLSYRHNNFEIEFSALDYKSMSRNQYSYKLENHDDNWHEIGLRRFINFNNLNPGTYKLLVKSSNSHNVWNNSPAELSIKINPPFWQTWYALLIYVLIIIGIVTFIRWNAIKQERLANSLEVEKLQHEQDKKLNEMKLRFFTNMSHEFRTPLTLILAPLKELLSKKDKYQLSPEAQNKIGIVQNNSARLMKLVNQLLDFRKVESGNMKLRASETNINELVAEICFPFYELAQINNITFSFKESKNIHNIWVDRDKIEIILNNLISNAFKYIKENGKIEVALYDEEDEVLLCVSDNGPGIAPSEINHVFDRFYQVGKNKEIGGSSGIGLALAKRLVGLHKGSISVVSKPNEHTEFTVTLPKGKKSFADDEIVDLQKPVTGFVRKEQFFSHVLPTKQEQPEKSDCTILVVEDNTEVNQYLKSLLQPLYNVLVAENGADGYGMAVENIPDLIISDVMMPQIDGFELCKKIKENEKTGLIPFVFLTAKTDEQFRLLGTQLGADDFISKPFDPAFLLEKVRNILQNRVKLQKQYSKSVRLEPSDIEITSSEEIFIEKIISLIEKNLQNHKFSSEVLASEMNMSNSSLYRKLKGVTNYSTAEFIRSIRIKRAAQLLADRQRTITEIAYEVGFNDVKHFRSVFQKQFKCSPSEYREKL